MDREKQGGLVRVHFPTHRQHQANPSRTQDQVLKLKPSRLEELPQGSPFFTGAIRRSSNWLLLQYSGENNLEQRETSAVTV